MNFSRKIKRLCDKLKNWLYHKTTTSRLGDYTLTTVEPRFKAVRPKRVYKTMYSLVEGNSNVVIQNG